ncbi:hypothetical protein PYW07_010192 [Mythimna separata]|uniref:Cytosolic beta-glucosidase n=1 Tax=Mythimna separata TaxID=271217 RepID=A0AAD7YH25_MYTSE|nr:hypothetical protein PYW07_010192 [Mythimna separata]
MKLLVALSLVVATCFGSTVRQQRRFPDDFIFGAATSSYQIEGAWNEDGKGENIYDYETHNYPEGIADGSNGDIAADSYHNYKRDVEMLRELGVDAYRFSISWARILPTGFADEVNPAGIAYYNNLIDEMLKYNIAPLVTIYHWDLPKTLQDLGGFLNPEFVDWFEDYARVVFENFGDRVKKFITFNEPREICIVTLMDTGSDVKDKLNSKAVTTYLCAKHLLVAHAKAYKLYDQEFRAKQGGECGITISVNWFGAATESPEDIVAAELRRQGEWGLFAHPIFSAEGGFPKEFGEALIEKNASLVLADFTHEEKAFIRGTADFFGVNHYTASLVYGNKKQTESFLPSIMDELEYNYMEPDDNWPAAASSWLTLAPDSIFKTLSHLRTLYNDPVFYITENGWSTKNGLDLFDDDRVRYYRASMESLLNSLDAGIKLKGYMAWSLMDNFEWSAGYTERFGLYHVDFSDPARTRTPKKSAFVYKHIVKHRYVDYEYEPDTMTMTIDEGH